MNTLLFMPIFFSMLEMFENMKWKKIAWVLIPSVATYKNAGMPPKPLNVKSLM